MPQQDDDNLSLPRLRRLRRLPSLLHLVRLRRVLQWAMLLGVVLCGVVPPRPAQAGVCACKQTAAGTCQRWHRSEIPWSLYFGPGQVGISDDVFELAAKEAFAAWSGIQCTACMEPNQAKTGCEPVTCDPQPLGPKFVYLGRTSENQLGFSCGGIYCPAGAPGSAQVGVIRDAADWPVSKSVVSALITTTKGGKIIDADIVLFDNNHSFCVNDCKESQYGLMGVLMQEVSHFLGIGYAENTLSNLAANWKTSALVVPTIDQDDVNCACNIYRTSDDLAECTTPTVAPPDDAGCQAGPLRPDGGSPWPLAGLALALCALLGVRWRQRSGTNSAEP